MSKLAVELLKFGIDSKEVLHKRLNFRKSQSLEQESDTTNSVLPLETEVSSTKPDKCYNELNNSMTDSPETSPSPLNSAGIIKNPLNLNLNLKKMKT
jgi:hypothetical protein